MQLPCSSGGGNLTFLTPHVIKNSVEADTVYKKKKDQIDKIKEGSIKMYKKGAGE